MNVLDQRLRVFCKLLMFRVKIISKKLNSFVLLLVVFKSFHLTADSLKLALLFLIFVNLMDEAQYFPLTCNYWLAGEVELFKYVSLLWIFPSDSTPCSVWGDGGMFFVVPIYLRESFT